MSQLLLFEGIEIIFDDLIDAVLTFLANFCQPQVEVKQCLVILHALLQELPPCLTKLVACHCELGEVTVGHQHLFDVPHDSTEKKWSHITSARVGADGSPMMLLEMLSSTKVWFFMSALRMC